jgi:hypothetical protein
MQSLNAQQFFIQQLLLVKPLVLRNKAMTINVFLCNFQRQLWTSRSIFPAEIATFIVVYGTQN